MALVNITDKERRVLTDVICWLEKYVDYFGGVESMDAEEETDAQMFSKMLPILKGLLNKKACKPSVKKVYVEKECANYNDIIDLINKNQIVKNYVDTAVRNARESIKPLYKYCVCDIGLIDDYCWVTNDIGRAMEFGVSQAKSRNKPYYVLSIKKCNDGSYKTFMEGVCDTIGYNESCGVRDYLHFDYIAQRYGYDNIKAIE